MALLPPFYDAFRVFESNGKAGNIECGKMRPEAAGEKGCVMCIADKKNGLRGCAAGGGLL